MTAKNYPDIRHFVEYPNPDYYSDEEQEDLRKELAEIDTRELLTENLITAAALGSTIASYLREHFADIADEVIGTVAGEGPTDDYINKIIKEATL